MSRIKIRTHYPDAKQFDDIFPRYESFFPWYGYQDIHLILACGVRGPDEATNKPKVMKRTEELAEKLFRHLSPG